jgi:acetolactate synthase-1/2/3 large subunit
MNMRDEMTTTSTGIASYEVPLLRDEGNVAALVADVVGRAGHLFGLMGNVHLISRLTRRGFPFTSSQHESSTRAMADPYHRVTGTVAPATTTYGVH